MARFAPSHAQFDDCELVRNVAETEGGAIFTGDHGITAELRRTTLRDNSAGTDGGALHAIAATLQIESTHILRNDAAARPQVT